jgi:hypothetical protein
MEVYFKKVSENPYIVASFREMELYEACLPILEFEAKKIGAIICSQQVNRFDDWITFMIDHYDYLKESKFYEFKYYEESLTFEQNAANFLTQLMD